MHDHEHFFEEILVKCDVTQLKMTILSVSENQVFQFLEPDLTSFPNGHIIDILTCTCQVLSNLFLFVDLSDTLICSDQIWRDHLKLSEHSFALLIRERDDI